MARRRDYAAEYARRQAKARAEGFEDYYGKRVRGGAKASPSAPKPTGERLRAARGHASRADLLRAARPGWLLIAQARIWYPKSREWERRVVIDITFADDPLDRQFVLHGRLDKGGGGARQLTRKRLESLVAQLEAKDVTFSPAPSLDLRLMAESEGDE